MNKKNVSVTFRCPEEMKIEIDKMANMDNRRMSSYIVNILDKEIKRAKAETEKKETL